MRIIEMAPCIPITLAGNNLGQRHRNLNSVVTETLGLGEPIDDILELPEKSAIDRLFKIDLAVKQKHVEYILKNIKEADMLYVSRALKAKWLLEKQYEEIINPKKLESDVYPHMILPAINKMKHWIHLNLRDESRCQQFYFYYCANDHKLAMKYLLKCPADLIVREITNFFKDETAYFYVAPHYYITPHYFKMFCERSPLVAKLVYDMIDKHKSFRLSYMDQQYEYFEGLKCILKTDPDTFLDIVEKHFNINQFNKFSTAATKFIMTYKKHRFLQKPELYAAWLLDMKELARCLNATECEDLVIQLARAKFLDPWFNYKNVEPLMKRLDKDKRVEFKKRVFVRKEVGEDIKDWPYPPPGPATEDDIFCNDSNDSGSDYEYVEDCRVELLQCVNRSLHCDRRTIKSHLDCLFDEYRFKGFSETLFELNKRILVESAPLNRMHIMLVLVSKSGGKEANLEALFEFLMRHRNEPLQVRAAVVRSMVRRISIWRASDGIWEKLLKFGEGLGLDGGTQKADCSEGLHAVVIRMLMKTGELTAEVKAEYLKCFHPLITEYTLSQTEKTSIMQILPSLLLDSINKAPNGENAAFIMGHLLNTLEVTETGEKSYDDVIPAVKKILERDETAGKGILMRLFESNIGRKTLFKENFDMIQLVGSYINALKHDISVVSIDQFLKTVCENNVELNRFLQKTSIYFAEDGGLSSRLLFAMKKEKPNKNLARPIAFLIGTNLKQYISKIDDQKEACKDDKDIKIFCADIRANAHLARPGFNLDSINWRQAGVKLVANKVLICKSVDVNKYIDQALLWKRSARLATVLAKRSDRYVEVLKSVAAMRPTIAIKVALEYFKRDQSATIIWKIIKPLLLKHEPLNKNSHLKHKLQNFNQIPESIRPEFIQIMLPLYSITEQEHVNQPEKVIYNRVLQQIHILLPKMEQQFMDNLLLTFLQGEFNPNTKGKISQYSLHSKVELYSDADMYVRILAKYILLCKNENEQVERFDSLGDLFFDVMDLYWQKNSDKKRYLHYINVFLQALKSNSAFFSKEHVSCLPVMKKVLTRMETYLHLREYFSLYVEIHLTMLYHTSVKQCMKLTPKVFIGEAKDQKKNKEGMMLVIEVFGKYVAREAKNLISKYFDSVVEIYSKVLKDYFHRFRESRHTLSLAFVKGLIEGSEGFEGRLAVDMYNEYRQDGENWDKVRKLMTEKFDKNMMFFFYNDIIANPPIRAQW